ncbi:uncharacterized protein EAE97_002647 [Botrytis byssoidea]|uniref:Uncharacterized protein n=1 Tax=Botrytis byssoidea TaxID=139641 RepID=A0A9P5M7N4_9HELO|nr:uncharacterized protein EAE97_002647 [Botrytis byssoidea]KAF7951096.1 hypothetical protein EAE97_002647 [Botrytis byssoidea]
MSAVNLIPEGTASSLEGMQQSSRKESFLKRCPEFAQDYDLLNRVLTIALICIQSNHIEDHYINRFLMFLGTKYLPCLIRERDNDPLPPYAVWKHRSSQYYGESHPSITSSCRQMLDSHSGSKSDLEFRGFLDKNCQFFLELCRETINPIPGPAPLKSYANFELQLVLVDRSLESKSKASVSTKVEAKMEDKVKGEVLGKLSELAGSIKSVIEVVANGGTKITSNGSNSLEQPSKKRKEAPE